MDELNETVVTEVKTKEEIKREQARERMAKARAKKKAHPAIKLSEVKDEEAPIATKSSAEPEIIWFGEVDMNKKGVPASDYPAYYFERQVEELKHEISDIERGLDLDIYTGKDKLKMRDELKKRKDRYEAIEASRPKLKSGDKDKLAKVFRELESKLGESMFTYSDMQRGTADAHVEAHRMVNPCIEIKSRIEADYCRQRGIPVVDGKISRNHASQLFQTIGKVIGEGIVDPERCRNKR